MDIGTATALTRYTYQTALAPGGQGQNAAVLQALGSTYDSLGSSALAGGAAALGALAGGMASFSDSGVSADFLALAGGADASAAASLFSASSGFDAALGLNGTLALAAYANRQEGLPAGTARSAALAEPASSTGVQEAILAAQSALSATTLNLLA